MTVERIVGNDDRNTSLVKKLKIKQKERGTCNARTRNDTPCQAPPVWNKANNKPRNGRCKLHGGLSTGARTEKGREAIRESNRRRANMKESFSGQQNI